MELIDRDLLDKVSRRAKAAARLRMNYNFHQSLDAPLHRLINAVEPGTYVRPHRHLNPGREESFLVLRGRVVFFLFDDEGNIIEHRLIDPLAGVYGMDIEAGVWHSLVVLEPDTVIYEAKLGPFVPLSDDNMAAWSPLADDRLAAEAYIAGLMKQYSFNY